MLGREYTVLFRIVKNGAARRIDHFMMRGICVK